MQLVTIDTIRIKEWLIKASTFDDQILIFFINYYTMASYCRVFYNEEDAYKFIDKFTKLNLTRGEK